MSILLKFNQLIYRATKYGRGILTFRFLKTRVSVDTVRCQARVKMISLFRKSLFVKILTFKKTGCQNFANNFEILKSIIETYKKTEITMSGHSSEKNDDRQQ